MRRNFILILAVMMIFTGAFGCATGKTVTRVSSDKITDLSGRWNDTDSQQVAQAIVTDCLAQPWLSVWKETNTGKPTVIVGRILNKSHEHINVETFVKDIQKSLINSQRVKFVSSSVERGDVRGERLQQHNGHTSEQTQAGAGQEIGAEFMMKGSLLTIPDEEGSTKVMWYQINVELHNITSTEIVWIGQHKIKKVIER